MKCLGTTVYKKGKEWFFCRSFYNQLNGSSVSFVLHLWVLTTRVTLYQ